MNQFESIALGIAAGSLAAGYLGTWRLVVLGVVAAVVSYVWRTIVMPLLNR